MLGILKYITVNNPWYTIPYRLLLAIFYQLYKRTFKVPIVKSLFNGKKMTLFPFSPNASAFIYTAIPDKAEVTLLRRLTNPDTVFLDVGANIGDYSVLLMDKVSNIYAFEAHPETAKLCKINFLLNGMDESRVIVKAVSDKVENISFSNLPNGSPINGRLPINKLSPTSSIGRTKLINELAHEFSVNEHSLRSDSSNTSFSTAQDAQEILVPAITLDYFITTLSLHENSNFILKIDVEGFEKEVLLGAKSLLTEYKVSGIILERFSDNSKEIKTLLEAWGYAIKPISTNNVFCYPITQNVVW